MRIQRTMIPSALLVLMGLAGCTSEAHGPGDPMVINPPTMPTDMIPAQPGPGPGQQPAPAPGQTPTQPPSNPMMLPPMPAAGSGATPMEPMQPMEPAEPSDDPRGACNLDSGYPDDHACILPPAANEGFQIHVGPTDYENPSAVAPFVFAPGMETSRCWTFRTPNTEEVFYQTSVLSGRAGTHHIINTMYMSPKTEGSFVMCSDGGTGTNSDIIANLPGASKAYMPRRPVAPENANLGRSVPPQTWGQADMHYFNFTDQDILREFWMNIYLVPKEQVTGSALQIRGMGGIGWQIQPGENRVYQYAVSITGDGRIIDLLGHYHAHGIRFSAYLQKAGGPIQKVFEMYDYNDPLIFDYNSVTQNPPFSDSAGGATSGILEVKNGDTLYWECHINNDSQNILTYTNLVQTGEMCNLWGTSVGPRINEVLFLETPFTAP